MLCVMDTLIVRAIYLYDFSIPIAWTVFHYHHCGLSHNSDSVQFGVTFTRSDIVHTQSIEIGPGKICTNKIGDWQNDECDTNDEYDKNDVYDEHDEYDENDPVCIVSGEPKKSFSHIWKIFVYTDKSEIELS